MAARAQAGHGAGAGACHVYHFAEPIADRVCTRSPHMLFSATEQRPSAQIKQTV